MIPADLTARLRMLTEASFFQTDQPVHQLNRAREIPADLPEFKPGQRLTATIERPLADGQFRALVAGKTVTLALPQGVAEDLIQPGRTLALEVTRSTPEAVHAQIVPSSAAAEAPPALSQTGRLISVLLTGQPAAEPAPLAGGKPLLAAPPASGSPLVPVLQEALTQSGLFYESHQVQWLAGKVSTMALRQEPQGQFPVPQPGPAVPDTARPEVASIRDLSPAPVTTGEPLAPEQSESGVRRTLEFSGAESDTPTPPPSARTDSTPARGAIPDRLMPVVSQQLDALATQQFAWQGQVWPGQTMEWQIEDPTGGRGEAAENQDWNTSLRLTLPRLGSVEARLQLSASGVNVRLVAAEPEAQADLAANREALARGLDAAHVPLLGLTVEPADGGA